MATVIITAAICLNQPQQQLVNHLSSYLSTVAAVTLQCGHNQRNIYCITVARCLLCI